jgi:hypothetical protein
MAEHVIDLTNYRDKVGTRVTPGRYTVVVEDAESDKSRAGNPMINLFFRVQGGQHDGATIVDRLTLTEKALFRVVGFMQALGFPTPKKRIKVNTNQFVGRTLQIDVEDGEPFNGRIKSEVRGYLRLDAADAEETADEDYDETADAEDDEIDVEDVEDVEDDDEPEAKPAKKKGKVKKPEADTDDGPETVDLDDLDLG